MINCVENLDLHGSMGRGYCICDSRQRSDGTCGNPECSMYRRSRTGSNKMKAKIKRSPFLNRSVRRRMSKKGKQRNVPQPYTPTEPHAAAAPPVHQQEQVLPAAVPEITSPTTPTMTELSRKNRMAILQILWEQLNAVREVLGPVMSCRIIGSAIRIVELVEVSLPRMPNRQLAAAFLNSGADVAGSEDTQDAVPRMHPGSVLLEVEVMNTMRQYCVWVLNDIQLLTMLLQ